MTSSQRGRPRDLKKRSAILDAGREVFGSGGTRPVTVEQVAARAGVSRGTFYAHFPDIDDFLEAVVRQESDRIVEGAALSGAGPGDLREVLKRFGVSLLTFLCDDRMQAFERRLTAEVDTRPELALRFFHAGPARARDSLVAVIAAAMEQGELTGGDPNELVSDLIGLWQGFHRMELVFRAVANPAADELERRATRGVELFMKLYGRVEKS